MTKTTTITHTVELPASPSVVYSAWLDGKKHAAMTGGPATGSAKVGGSFTAWGGYITGRNVELLSGKRIVQTWRTSQFPKSATDSRLELRLEKSAAGTRLTMIHSDVPASQAKAYDVGWSDHYWTPMLAYLRVSNRTEKEIKTMPAKKKTAKKTAKKAAKKKK